MTWCPHVHILLMWRTDALLWPDSTGSTLHRLQPQRLLPRVPPAPPVHHCLRPHLPAGPIGQNLLLHAAASPAPACSAETLAWTPPRPCRPRVLASPSSLPRPSLSILLHSPAILSSLDSTRVPEPNAMAAPPNRSSSFQPFRLATTAADRITERPTPRGANPLGRFGESVTGALRITFFSTAGLKPPPPLPRFLQRAPAQFLLP